MNAPTTAFQFLVELTRPSSSGRWKTVAQVPVDVDFAPALEWARFAAQRHSNSTALTFAAEPWQVEPWWDSQLGEPYVQALRIVAAEDEDGSTESQLPIAYFANHARQAANELVESGQMQAGDEFSYRVCAYPRQAPRRRETPIDAFTVEEETAPIPLPVRRLATWQTRATPYGQAHAVDMPVFLPQTLIDEAVEQMHGAGPVEIGGILIGRLYRDPDGPEVFAEVTAQIPARHAQQELTRLTFTADTWTDVDAALRLRGMGEIYLGWWHTHPARAWCQDCPEEKRKKCKLTGEFFSDHDASLHRCVFPRAYSIALVISDSYATGLTWPLFGWRHGMMQMRGFHLLDEAVVGASSVMTG